MKYDIVQIFGNGGRRTIGQLQTPGQSEVTETKDFASYVGDAGFYIPGGTILMINKQYATIEGNRVDPGKKDGTGAKAEVPIKTEIKAVGQ